VSELGEILPEIDDVICRNDGVAGFETMKECCPGFCEEKYFLSEQFMDYEIGYI
jgi:hypothetical protein